MALYTFSWIAFYALHSLLAATRVKSRIRHFLGPVAFRFYRLGYNLLFILVFLGLLYWQQGLPAPRWWGPWLPLQVLAWSLLLGGGVIGILAFRHYRLSEFSGWEMWRGQDSVQPEHLVISGFNGYVRHPVYFATLLILAGYFLWHPALPHAITAGLGIAYLLIGTRLEERKLVQTFGQAYRDYQRKVPMLIPLKWR